MAYNRSLIRIIVVLLFVFHSNRKTLVTADTSSRRHSFLHRLIRRVRPSADPLIATIVRGAAVLSIVQATHTVLKDSVLSTEITRRMFGPERIKSLRKIRSIMAEVHEKHGVVDVLKEYPTRIILSSMFAMSRLQEASRLSTSDQSPLQQPFNTTSERDLLHDLLHYSTFASAAYGWKLEFALRGKLHGRDDNAALSTRTGVREEDVVSVKWESEQVRPAYFIARDHNRSSIVLSIRGTFSLDDILTDLCFTPENFAPTQSKRSNNKPILKKVQNAFSSFSDEFQDTIKNRKLSCHLGMLEAAQSLRDEVESVLEDELEKFPSYSLVLVGHSMGGGVASLLGTLMERTFPKLAVYAYGPPCVAPSDAKLHKNIISVVAEGDPFRCLSLGHVAGMSESIAEICEDADLRTEIIRRGRKLTEEDNLRWCQQTLADLRDRMKAEKLYPPGRILFVSQAAKKGFSLPFQRAIPDSERHTLSEVSPHFFQDFFVPTVFDLTHHSPASYEASLHCLVQGSKS